MSGPLVDVVYRGPFQGRRLAFLLDTLDELGARQRFWWLCPDGDRAAAAAQVDAFMAPRLRVRSAVLDGRAQGMPGALRALADRRRERADLVLAVGFTALPYARAVRAGRLVWCVNGVPEERLLHADDRRRRAMVEGLWRSTRVGRRPDAAVVVSRPMAGLLRDRVGDMPVAVAPTVVDRSTFRLRPPGPGAMTYIGTGAPWQNLPMLAEIWAAMHRLDPDLRFLVVSRDERAEVLRRALPDGAVRVVAAHSPPEVAEHLRATQLGFIVRRPHLVNEVSYPTKFGEYVASGVGVVTTDIGWDIAELVRATGCGLVVDAGAGPEEVAAQVVELLASGRASSEALTQACDAAASRLDRADHVKQLAAFLGGLLG